MTVLAKGARISGEARTKLAAKLQSEYKKGATIRSLADAHGRSYGFIHRLLLESGMSLRGRGGAGRVMARPAKR